MTAPETKGWPAQLSRVRLAVSWLLAPLSRILSKYAAAGTSGYPPDTQRRLKILNVISLLIVITTLVFAAQQAAADFDKMKPVIIINIILAAMAMMVPLAHRINDIAAAIVFLCADGGMVTAQTLVVDGGYSL